MIIFGRTRRGNLIGIAPDELGKWGVTIVFPSSYDGYDLILKDKIALALKLIAPEFR